MEAGFRAEKALGYQQITDVSSAVALTVPAGTSLALIVPEVQAVRWRDDGTNPTATVGMPLAIGAMLIFTAQSLAALRFIEQAASAKLNVTYYG